MDEGIFNSLKSLLETEDKLSYANAQPTHLQPLFVAVAKINNKELQKTIQVGEKLANALKNGKTNDADMLEESFVQLHKVYKALPSAATDVILSQAPAQARPVLSVAKEMNTKSVKAVARDIPSIIEAGKKLQDTNTKNADCLSHIDTDAIERIHSHYKSLNNKAKRALIREIPEQARPVAKAMAHMDSKQVTTIVKQLPELTKAMDVVMQKDGNYRNKNAHSAKRLEAAKKIHRAFKLIPAKARQEMAEVLPKEARGLTQLADGIEEDDIEILLKTIDEKSSKSGTANSSNDEDYDSIEKGEEKKTEEQLQKEKMIQGAKVVVRAETRRLWQWIRQGPLSLRVLTFLCGLSLIVSGALGFWIEIFNKFRFFAIGANVYIFLAGILVSSLEIKSVLCTTYIRSQVYNFFHFLSLMKGRGGFLLFFALFNFAIIDPTIFWTELLNFISGVLCCIVGIFTVIAGLLAERKLKSARTHLGNINEVREAFDAADEFGEGKLSPDGIVELLNNLEPPTILTKAELMAAINLMDTDHNGYVETAEFLDWYTGSNTTSKTTKYGAAETKTNTPSNSEFNEVQRTCMEKFSQGFVSFVTTISLVVVCIGAVSSFSINTMISIFKYI